MKEIDYLGKINFSLTVLEERNCVESPSCACQALTCYVCTAISHLKIYFAIT